jgi:uncharacterized membrane protein
MADIHSASPSSSDSRTFAIVVYALLMGAVVSYGVLGVAGALLAYAKRDSSQGTMWQGHFRQAIETFWIGLGLYAAATVAGWFHFGWPLYLAAAIFVLYRAVRGLVLAVESQPYA